MFELPLQVAALMRGFKPAWFVAGGWAIDLYLGKTTRPHEDIEIAVFRPDQLALQKHLQDWILKKAENASLQVWREGEFLELPVHVIHCFNEKKEFSFLEVLLNETRGEDWIFRRDERVTKPLAELSLESNQGIKFLCPEVVLLYKSKNPRAKDEQDFRIIVSHLDAKRREWLKSALSVCYSEHHWMKKL